MNKLIKYGVVAGLTMAAFSLTGVPASSVYADGECTVTAGDNYTYTFSSDCVLNNPIAAIAPVNDGSNWDHGRMTLNDKTYALNAVGLTAGAEYKVEIYADGNAFVPTYAGTIVAPERSVTKVSDETYTYAYQDDSKVYASIKKQGGNWMFDKFSVVKGANGSGTITLDLDGLEDGTYDVEIGFAQDDFDAFYKGTFTVTSVVELESVEATINDEDKIVATYNTGYEGEPILKYVVEEDYKGIVTVAADGAISVAETYKTAADKEVTIMVKATDGKTVSTTVTYTIETNYTAVEASFEDDKDTIKVSGDTTIVIEKVDGVDYEYVYDGVRLTIDKDGKVTVNEDTLLGEDTEFTITIKAIVDGVEIAEKDLTLTVEKNYTASFKEPLFEIIDGAKIEAGKPVVVEIDAKMDGLWNIVVFNKALFEKYLSGEDMTEEELESRAYQLAEDDCTVTEGSTIITLSDAFLAKLPAGDYLLRAYFYDNSDVDDIKEGYAESVFSVAAAPDTGAYTASTSATSSVLASVLAAVTAAGAVVVAKFAKRK